MLLIHDPRSMTSCYNIILYTQDIQDALPMSARISNWVCFITHGYINVEPLTIHLIFLHSQMGQRFTRQAVDPTCYIGKAVESIATKLTVLMLGIFFFGNYLI